MDTQSFPLPADNDALEEDSFGLTLFRVRVEMHRLFDRTLEARNFSLTFTQYRVLLALERAMGRTASELARCLDYDAGAMTRLIDRLADQGYVQRKACDQDRRVARLSLTEMGVQAVQPVRQIVNELARKALADLSADEQKTLKNLLLRVRTTLSNMP